MIGAIKPGYTPPQPGQHKEEPELSQEDDIPSDDGGDRPADEPIFGDPDQPG